VLTADLVSGRVHGQLAEIDAIGTHVRYLPAFIQLLREQHRPADRITQFAAGFLLKGRSSKRSGWRFLPRLHLDIRDRITGTDTALKEFLRVVGGRLFS